MRRSLTLPIFFCLLAPLSCTLLVDFEPEDVTPEDCYNGFDDDGDGYADCRDQDCQHLTKCFNLYEDCYNWEDDNSNGLVDCEDPECARSDNCLAQSDFCNDTTGNGELTMYASVYPDSAGACPPMMECRVELISSDGVPRCLLAMGGRLPLESCDNDHECPMGHICQWSETIGAFGEEHRPVCLPLCANPLNIPCPDNLRCMNLWTIWDEVFPGQPVEVTLMSCDKPLCDVLNADTQVCRDVVGTCYPEPDMMGQGYCAPSGIGGHLISCDQDSDCLPLHRCERGVEGDRGQCRRVCLTQEDCIGLEIEPSDFECVKSPSWATYGICTRGAIGW